LQAPTKAPEVAGRPLLEQQQRSYQSIRGKDRRKHMQAWKEEAPVWKNDEGYYITKVTHPDDLIQEGVLMGHCAGYHMFWVEQGVYVLLSLRGPDSVPHVTIHLKPVEWFGKEHPADKLPMPPTPHEKAYNPDIGTRYRPWYRCSGYEGVGSSYGFSGREVIEFEGKPHVVISGGTKGYGSKEQYSSYIREWLEPFLLKGKLSVGKFEPQAAEIAV
jgi:hypothetical protein